MPHVGVEKFFCLDTDVRKGQVGIGVDIVSVALVAFKMLSDFDNGGQAFCAEVE